MRYAIFLLLLCSTMQLAAQNDTRDPDIKVGLVLSGGGAKGLAHIGVIKKIEEAGVRIDYIGGTSMGAIVGGLYASGYSAKQLDSIFAKVDFDNLIQDNIPRGSKTFYEKAESEKYAITLPFDNFDINFPSGLSKGQNVYNLLSRLLSHVSEVDDFSKLPIPFFCVATDAERGKEVLLDKGYLPRAIVASGALPSVFSPVMLNDTLMIDGGVINNYPITLVKQKGVDFIIGVDVQDSLRTRKELASVFDILTQVNNFSTVQDMVAKREQTDLYIAPNIDGFTVISFDEGRKIIQSGEDEASLVMKELVSLAEKQRVWTPKPIDFDQRQDLYITNVEIEGTEAYTRSYVLGKLKLKVPDRISYQKFSDGVNNLAATGNFETIDYRLERTEGESAKIVFKLRESNSKMQLRLGAHYDELFKAAALINVTRKRLLTNNDIASLDFVVGDNLRYNFNYYIDKGHYWSVGVNSRFDNFEQDVSLEFIRPDLAAEEDVQLNELDIIYQDLTNQLYFETLFKRHFLFGLGAEHKWLRYLSETIGIDENLNPRTIFEDTNYFSTYGYLKYDTLDNSFFPNEGYFFEGDFHLYLFANGRNTDFDQFSIAQAKVGYAVSFWDKFSLFVSTEGGFKIGNEATQSLDFFVGGYGYNSINNIIPFYGYEALSLRGNTYLKSSANLDYEIFDKNHISAFVNIANVADDLFESTRFVERIDYSAIGLGYGVNTFLGPLEVKYAYSPEQEEGIWHVTAGFKF